ncbi:MAG: DUF4290 domain-containing protein [Bacteroidales bacterium]|jgi:hypothetical protein
MEYNTTRELIPITEYGRNIKKMIDYTITIEDREKRNRMAKAIVNVMTLMNPQMRDNYEHKHKLWDHLFILSDFKLDIDAPYPMPVKIGIDHKPEKIAYPTYNIAFKHYGNNIERIIKKAIEMEDGEQKNALILTIANQLKKSYLNWNRDSVTDEVIADHLDLMSQGKLKLGADVRLSDTRNILASNKRRITPKQNQNNSRRNTNSFQRKSRNEQNNNNKSGNNGNPPAAKQDGNTINKAE